MQVGSLVDTACDIPGSPLDDPVFPGFRTTTKVKKGTTGLIVKRPTDEKPRQYLVQLVGNKEMVWLFHHELQPHF